MSERAAEGPSSESHGKASDEFKECPTNAEPSLGYEGFGIAMKERIPSSDGQYREFEILLGREIQKSRRNSMVLFYKVFRVEHLPTSSYRIFVEFFLNSFKYFLYFDIPRNPDPKKSKKVRVIIYVQNKESPITTTCITRARVFGTKISEVLSTVSGEVSWTKLSWEFGTESDLASAQYDDDNFEYNAMEIRPGTRKHLRIQQSTIWNMHSEQFEDLETIKTKLCNVHVPVPVVAGLLHRFSKFGAPRVERLNRPPAGYEESFDVESLAIGNCD